MRQSQSSRDHRTKYAIGVLAQMLLVATSISVAAADNCEVDAFEWRKASPASQGMDGAKLAAMKDSLAGRGTKALLVIRNDRIIYEWYQKGHGPNQRHNTASMAKAIVGGV